MSNIVPFSFESQEVRVAKDTKDTPWFVAKDVAACLGYDQTANGLKHCKHASVLAELNKINDLAPATKWIPESDVYRMTLRCNLPSAVAFQDWIVDTVLPAIRKTGTYSVVPPSIARSLEVEIAEAAARMLRMSETSKVRMLASICEMKGVSSRFLPSYVDEPLVRAITQLLKGNHSGLSAKAANLVLVEMGYLEELERVGASGDIKRFKSLTNMGLRYGRNETSPNNPRETQPLYYVDKFPELLARITEYLETDEP